MLRYAIVVRFVELDADGEKARGALASAELSTSLGTARVQSSRILGHGNTPRKPPIQNALAVRYGEAIDVSSRQPAFRARIVSSKTAAPPLETFQHV